MHNWSGPRRRYTSLAAELRACAGAAAQAQYVIPALEDDGASNPAGHPRSLQLHLLDRYVRPHLGPSDSRASNDADVHRLAVVRVASGIDLLQSLVFDQRAIARDW